LAAIHHGFRHGGASYRVIGGRYRTYRDSVFPSQSHRQ